MDIITLTVDFDSRFAFLKLFSTSDEEPVFHFKVKYTFKICILPRTETYKTSYKTAYFSLTIYLCVCLFVL